MRNVEKFFIMKFLLHRLCANETRLYNIYLIFTVLKIRHLKDSKIFFFSFNSHNLVLFSFATYIDFIISNIYSSYFKMCMFKLYMRIIFELIIFLLVCFSFNFCSIMCQNLNERLYF